MNETGTIRMEGIRLIGITLRLNNEPASLEKIPQLWDQFFSRGVLATISGDDRPIYEVYYDYSGDASGDYTLMLGTKVEAETAVPEGMTEIDLPAAVYATFSVAGPDGIKDAWKEIWMNKSLKRTYTGDFEVIDKNGVTIYVAVEP